jgi:hypothetical protein
MSAVDITLDMSATFPQKLCQLPCHEYFIFSIVEYQTYHVEMLLVQQEMQYKY